MQLGVRRINLDMALSRRRACGQMHIRAKVTSKVRRLTRNQARAYAQERAAGKPGPRAGEKSTGDENMATLREAVSQLDTAIQHLEQALDASADSDDPGTAQLRSSLEEANSRSAELTAVAEQVALRLDRAVARVTAILES